MKPYYQDGPATLYQGDCIEVLRELPDASVHAVVTDPPYGLGFMGREWDDLPPGLDFAVEALRVLKPGGHLLAFGGTRTWHRLAVAVEDAGFEIRDSIAWLYGSGFPKSLDVSKAIDKGAGLWRGRAGAVESGNGSMSGANYERTDKGDPITAAAVEWEGWGTALKPSFEPIVVARKPLAGTVAANVIEHGTGALNIDATRIHTAGSEGKAYTVKRLKPGATLAKTGGSWRPGDDTDLPWEAGREFEGQTKDGRWPTNVILDESQAADLDRQSGVLRSGVMPVGTMKQGKAAGILGEFKPQESTSATYGDEGGASRFFPTFRYEAKAPSSERPQQGGVQHPTVKPLDLMRWLCRLVTPPGGVILEPFAGSGTTLEAALMEGFDVIGIEREADYLPLIMSRLSKPIAQTLDLGGDAA